MQSHVTATKQWLPRVQIAPIQSKISDLYRRKSGDSKTTLLINRML